jgi:hypothetical protein
MNAGLVVDHQAGTIILGYSKAIRQQWLLGQGKNNIKRGYGSPGQLTQTQEVCDAVPAGRPAFHNSQYSQYWQGWNPILALSKGACSLLGIVP